MGQLIEVAILVLGSINLSQKIKYRATMTGTNTVLYGQKTNYEKDHLDKCTIFYSGNKFCLITTAKNTYI